MPAISPACLEAFVLAAGICLTAAFVLTKSKTASEKMLLRKKRKKQCMGGAGTERGGSPTTRAFDNPKTAADWQGYVSSSHFLLELLSLHSFSPAHV
jgi:hypothetical protein